jgi:hypothetical protein
MRGPFFLFYIPGTKRPAGRATIFGVCYILVSQILPVKR